MGFFGSKKEQPPQVVESPEDQARATLEFIERQKEELVTGNIGNSNWTSADRELLVKYSAQIAELKKKLGIEIDEEEDTAKAA
jgi:hypothetical protein